MVEAFEVAVIRSAPQRWAVLRLVVSTWVVGPLEIPHCFELWVEPVCLLRVLHVKRRVVGGIGEVHELFIWV